MRRRTSSARWRSEWNSSSSSDTHRTINVLSTRWHLHNFIVQRQCGSLVLLSRRQSQCQPPPCMSWQRWIIGTMPWSWVSVETALPLISETMEYNFSLSWFISHILSIPNANDTPSLASTEMSFPDIRHIKNIWSCAILQDLCLQYYICVHGRINFWSIGFVSFDATIWAWGA